MTTTQMVMAISVIILLAYDGYAALKGGLPNTISFQMVQLSKAYPIIPFAMGVLMGHFYWQM